MSDGAVLLMLATTPPRKDIFLKMPRISLQPLNFEEVRAIMLDEAEQMGIRIDASRLAALQERSGGNPQLARRVVREEMLSIIDNCLHRC
jgi:Holliday junction resolvasome RuvABC ATP-dependent DNA helicase subunit